MKPSGLPALQLVAVLTAVLTAGCSGGGGGNIGNVMPTSTATTTMATTPSGPLALGAFGQPSIAAPAPASLGGNAPLIASGATLNFANLPTGTVFPLNQSALENDGSDRTVTGFTYPNGTTLTFLGNKQANGVNVGMFEFKFANDDITLPGDGSAVTIPNSGNTMVGLTTSNLNYTLLASWVIPDNNGFNVSVTGVGVSGYQTPGSGVPASGTATYLGIGGATGTVVTPAGATGVKGDVTVNVNFGTGSIGGALTNMNVSTTAGSAPWNAVSLSGSLSGATISGSAAVMSSPAGGAANLDPAATGSFNGALYGPSGQELGAVWSLHDTVGGGHSALGLIGATKQ